MSDEDKKYEPTDLRREKFREEGRFARARDAGGIVAVAAFLGVLAGTRERFASASALLFQRTLGDMTALERGDLAGIVHVAAGPLVLVSAGAVALGAAGAVVVGLAQAGFRPYTKLVGFKLERLDPRAGLSRLFTPRKAGGELALAAIRLLIGGAFAYRGVAAETNALVGLARLPLPHAVGSVAESTARAIAHVVAGLAVGALLDYGWSWWTLEKEMRMSHKERQEEARQQDGDPKNKQRMRARARALARQRSLRSVKNADVIVTNPTHLAVALRYGPKDPAPVVITKGEDDHALEIRRTARKHGIPILENRPLARALYADVVVGKPIPPAHFVAVAHVLAFVYRLKKRGALKG
jgi:flagellar biosynthetic protein FlhB